MSLTVQLRRWHLANRENAAKMIERRPYIAPPWFSNAQGETERFPIRTWDPKDFSILDALTDRSCVLLKNFLPADEAGRLARLGMRCFNETDLNLARTAKGRRQIPSEYSFLRDGEPEARMGNDRHLRAFGGMTIEAVPAAGYELFELLKRADALPMVQAYIGGKPLVSGSKCSLRLGDKSAPVRHVFHQDGSFLGGAAARTVNIWIALTAAGERAPGLELLPERLPEILPTGRPGAAVHWEVDQDDVYLDYPRDQFVIPAFEPGDAIMFDQMCLHRTHVRSTMTELRLAYECWFFPPDPKYQGLDLLAI